ncbi:histidine--tRNA ligase, cytoplasmic-like [Mangifera indica]|uniref:histidine--tRNA ligase, cytoplasmic-like n=1 Tax=Mangifera indica TaxID=29780 RepID=UPI001CFA86FC|nr:histidine--tRNA ligase, cytoplasmic-like [Mangifera indica]XP_044475373.1 histidine--tRNA ligase, cytoplasmic-like [Mangifera indica]
MPERGSSAVITLGGKGASLTSSSVYAISNSLAHVRLDSSALDRLSSSPPNQNPPTVTDYQVPLLKALTLEESRASLTVLLSKLLSLQSGSGVRAVLPVHISEILNSGGDKIASEPVEVSEDERALLEKLSLPSVFCGVCAVLDYKSTALSTIIDAVAALSCEVSGADVAAFNSIDLGDGFTAKEEIAVAGDLKVLLNGSKLVGKVNTEEVLEIPKINGKLREVVKLVHSSTRIELNSGVRVGISGTAKALGANVMALVSAVKNVGESSLFLAKMSLSKVGGDELKSLFGKDCLSLDSLRSVYKLVLDAHLAEDYIKFVHEANVLLELVLKIVAWEAVIAFAVLEGGELLGEKVNGGDVGGEKKSEKKKKKVVLGKGTGVIVQLIKDRLQSKGLGVLDKQVEDLFSFLDPKDPGFDGFLAKIKEIVESNESRRLPKLPKGTRDFAKEQMAIREKAFSIITEVFKRHGATALDTPVFELRETLTGKYGEDSKLIYDLADQGGELCSLRYDLTVPFARYVAMNGLTSLKRHQIAKVYRRDNPSKGRFREFYQCDFDIAGQYERMGPDFEVIKILTELLDELDIGDYEIKLNHRMLLDGMLEICGVPPEKFRTICSSIDKLDKQSFEQVKKEMVEEKGLTVEMADKIGTFVKERGSPLVLLSKLKQEGSKFLENNSSKVALDDLEILFQALEKSKCVDKVVFDLSLARGLDYYTGVIYEAVFKGETQVGSIAAGGRYDNLIGMFGTKQVPAVGVSLGIERVFTIMEQLQKERDQTVRATETQVLVALLGDKLPQAAELVSELWNAKVKAEFMVHKKVMKLIDRARESKIPWMVIVGERELNEGIVKLKNIDTTVEETIPRSKFVEELQIRLNQ